MKTLGGITMKLGNRSKTIYLSDRQRRNRQPKDMKKIGAIAIALGLVAGLTVAFLPNAYEITIGDEVIAIVDKKEHIDTALETIEVQLENQYQTEVQLAPIDKVKKVHASKKELTDPNKLAGYLRKELPIELQFQRLMVDGKEIGIIKSEEELDTLMTQLKGKYFRDKEVEAKFTNDVKLEPVFTTEDKLTPMDELVDLATKKNKEIITYEVKPGDSFWAIANKHGVSVLDIINQNEGMTETTPLKIGRELNIEVKVPVLGLELIEPEPVAPVAEEPAKGNA